MATVTVSSGQVYTVSSGQVDSGDTVNSGGKHPAEQSALPLTTVSSMFPLAA
jgi:hypothetical protein